MSTFQVSLVIKFCIHWGDNEDVGRKVIVISPCLLEDIDFLTKIAILDATYKYVSVDFLLLEKVSGGRGALSESIDKFNRNICDLENCLFRNHLSDAKVLCALVREWLKDLRDEAEHLQARLKFKRNILGSLNQICYNLFPSFNHIIDEFEPCQVWRCHNYPLDDERGNKLVKSTSCPITDNELAALDLIRNSLKVSEHLVLLMPSFHYYIKLQHANSPIDFNIIKRTNLGSLSEGAEKYTQTSITPIVVSDHFRNLDFPLESLSQDLLKREPCFKKLISVSGKSGIEETMSSVQLSLDFLFLESLVEAVRLVGQIRELPNDHDAKLQILEAGKISLYAASSAIQKSWYWIQIILSSDESQRDDHSDDVLNEIPEPRKGKREDPRTYNEAIQSRDYAFWKEAIDDKIGSIMENNTWVLSNLPPGCKWIFKRKMKVDGTVDKVKARLVIQGFRQKEGIDYFDTYAPVARITTIRLLLALVAIHNLVIHQMDVKTTFLNGDLKEVYMNQPEGFVMPGNEHKVCKLVKSLYGLKQAPKQWHQKFDEVVLSSGFHLNQSDKCVYSKFDDFGKGVIICLYVNDMLIFGSDQNQVDKTKKFLSSRFSMKDMGEVDVIFGIKIKRKNKEIVITQSHYIEKILKKFNREDCSSVSTPMDPVETLKLNTGKPVDQLEYSRAIGCLMYAMTSTRPNIAYAVGRLSRFTSNPSRQHWKAITRIFKYLRSTMNYGLSFVGYPSVLEAYSYASWINHVEDSSSMSGWVFLLGGGAISWASKKQTCITGSTMEYEFLTLAAAGKEAE
nr:zinc finger, CCHC-type [Tanacetum cinerariifolium]